MNLLQKLLKKEDVTTFYELVIQRSVIDQIIELAKQTDQTKGSDRKEFVAFLEGSIKEGVLTINKLVFQLYPTTKYATFSQIDFSGPKIIGIVRSHRTNDNNPSVEEKLFFKNHGIVHCIICRPYSEQTIACYNAYGVKIQFFVI